jgi:hypothetical protein
MFSFFAHSRYMPCPDCGASLEWTSRDEHECDSERWADFQMWELRSEIARFDVDLGDYLSSSKGRFEQWYAERTRRGAST